MLMAVLYCDPDRIAAAAFAGDQAPKGGGVLDRSFQWQDRKGNDLRDGVYLRSESRALLQANEFGNRPFL